MVAEEVVLVLVALVVVVAVEVVVAVVALVVVVAVVALVVVVAVEVVVALVVMVAVVALVVVVAMIMMVAAVAYLDERVCLESCCIKYFTDDAWKVVRSVMDLLQKNRPIWYCGRCTKPISGETEDSIA